MEISEIKELLEIIQSSGIEEFEMEKEGVRIKVRNARPIHASLAAPVQPIVQIAPPLLSGPAPVQPVPAPVEEESLHVFKAPIVGTFYLTPKPDADPFVSIGDRVGKNAVLCIIEAMKIFNQIESDVSGEVVDILVENGQPVEYGQPLFKIRLT